MTKKAQTTLIAVVLIVFVFAILIAFLSSFTDVYSQEKYLEMYTNNALVSILNTDTGHTNFPDSCKRIVDVLFCAEFTPSFRCGGTECSSLANILIETHMPKILKPQMGWLLKYGGKTIGDPGIEAKKRRWIANQNLRRGEKRLDIQLLVSEV